MKKFLIVLFVIISIPVIYIRFYFDAMLTDKLDIMLDKVPNMSISIGSVTTSFFPPSILINNISVKNGLANDIWKEATIVRIRVTPDLQSLRTSRIIIDDVTVVEPTILCDINQVNVPGIVQQEITNATSGKSGKPGLAGIFHSITQIIKGTTGLGESIVKTIIDPKTIFHAPTKKAEPAPKTPSTINLKFIIKNVYIKQGTFIPMQDIFLIKAGDKVNLPDINLTNVNQNSVNTIIENAQQVVIAAVKQTLLNLQNNGK